MTMKSNLYISRVGLSKEISKGNYLRDLPVVKNLRKMDGIRLTRNVTFPGEEVLEITEDGIRSVNYKDTEHFMVTKRFMDAPEKILESLLG